LYLVQNRGRIFGPDISDLDRIIRPPLEKRLRTRRARDARHPEGWPDISARYFRFGRIFRPPQNRLRTRGRVTQKGGLIFQPDISDLDGYFDHPQNRLRTKGRVTQKGGRIFRPDISNLGRIFRPPLKSAKDQKMARCASPRLQAGYLAGYF
jgi:hypothetical protein